MLEPDRVGNVPGHSLEISEVLPDTLQGTQVGGIMAELRISEKDFTSLRSHILGSGGQEEAAILLAGVFYKDRELVFTVREVIPVANDQFQTKHGLFLEIDPVLLSWVTKRCKNENLTFIMTHSHPFSDRAVGFSGIDDAGEESLVPRLRTRIPNKPFAFLVFGQKAVAGRYWSVDADHSEPINTIRVVGEHLQMIPTSNSDVTPTYTPPSDIYARQMLALGEDTQNRLHELHVGIVGLGGLGSQVFVQLAHLGVGHITVVDYDTLEASNRSRVIGSRPDDVGKTYKVDIMKRYAKESCPEVEVNAIVGDILNEMTARELLNADILFCCTDSIRSRAVLNRISFQYLIPLFDTGTHLEKEPVGEGIRTGIGRVMLIHPDGACLECTNVINDTTLRTETDGMSNPYVVGGTPVKEPQVISINGTVASLAVTWLLDAICGFQKRKPKGRYLAYRPIEGDLKLLAMTNETKCNLCREVRGYADYLQLPCKYTSKEEYQCHGISIP